MLYVLLSTSICLGATPAYIQGVVRDSISGEPLSFVNVYDLTGEKGVLTDDEGRFRISSSRNKSRLKVSSLGYNAKEMTATPGIPVEFLLSASTTNLEEFVVKPGKTKYSKRNPAVALMQRVRADYEKTDPRREPHYSFDEYEKLVLGLNDYKRPPTTNKHLKKFSFLRQNIDTSLVTGKAVLDLSMKERRSTRLFSANPKLEKEIVTAYRSIGVDESLNQSYVRGFLEDVARPIDIYDNDIALMQQRFVSPLSRLAADTYKFFITDTVMIGRDRCVELEFAPHNPATTAFNGKMYIPVDDSVKYVRRITMRTPQDINLNYVKNLFISQNFSKDSLGRVHKIFDDMTAEMHIVSGTQELYARRLINYDSFSYDLHPRFHEYYSKLGNIFQLEDSESLSPKDWAGIRMVPLSYAEKNLGNSMSKLREIPLIYWAEKIISILAQGYISTGQDSKFDFGHVNTFIGGNTAEGFRLRVGGMTTASLNPHLFARGYVAYGFRDHKWKYEAELEYSFNKKKLHSREFPMHSIRATHRYDVDLIGQHYLFTSQDNIFLAIKRKKSDLVTYRRFSDLSYILELNNHFSVTASFRHEIQEATRWLPFRLPGDVFKKSFSQAYFTIALRYAPNEKISQGRTDRKLVNYDAWIFQLTHDYGPKGFLGSAFTLNRTEISAQKRFWMSAFGYIDILLKGGKVWDSVQYPMLMWPNANLSYTIQPESYSLMNPMEFANDYYGAVDLTYSPNGALFNLIPGFKKLKLREIVTFKGLMGGLTKKNNPEYNDKLYRFPNDSQTHIMTDKPYMELGIGIDNILTIFRIDYIWRLTYRNHPGIDKSGIRIALRFSF